MKQNQRKRLVKYLLISTVSLITIGFGVACGENHTPDSISESSLEQSEMTVGLAAPKKVKAEFWKLSWEAVEGAKHYVVNVRGEEYETAETNFDLYPYLSPEQTYPIDVKAVSETEESKWTSFKYTTERVTKGLKYTALPNGTYAVSKGSYDLCAERLVLPDYYNNVPVTKIENHGFVGGLGYQNIYTKEIRLPLFLEVIGEYSFIKYRKLEEIKIPFGLHTINYGAFSGASKLSTVILPESVLEIGEGAFSNSALTKIEIPKNIQKIGKNAFRGCESLETVVAQDGIDYANLEMGGIVFHGSKWQENQPCGYVMFGEIVCGFNDKGVKSMIVTAEDYPTESLYYTDGIFYECDNIASVTIPNSWVEIPEDTFYRCTQLKEVIFTNNIAKIGENAFHLSGIESLELPLSVTEIERMAFSSCNNIKKLVIPENVTVLGEGAFSACNGLETLTINAKMNVLGNCFGGCKALKSVQLPSTVKKLSGTFTSCKSLTELILPDELTWLEAFSLSGTGIKNLILPRSLERIDLRAFTGESISTATTTIENIYFEGSEQRWNEIIYISPPISLGASNEVSVTPYYYSETEPSESGKYWRYVDGVPTIW